jgi:hypothetical protein
VRWERGPVEVQDACGGYRRAGRSLYTRTVLVIPGVHRREEREGQPFVVPGARGSVVLGAQGRFLVHTDGDAILRGSTVTPPGESGHLSLALERLSFWDLRVVVVPGHTLVQMRSDRHASKQPHPPSTS